MTVGTKLADLTYAYGGGKAGSYFKKTWSGADYPKVAPLKGSPKPPPRRVPGYLCELTKNLKPDEWARVSGKPYRIPARKVRPRRALRQEQHNYSCQYTTANYPRGRFLNKNNGLTGDAAYNAVAPMFANGVSPWTSNDDIALLGKLREKIVGTDFNLGVFLAEGSESLSMIATAATRLYKGIHYASKGNFVQAARSLTSGTPRDAIRKRRAVAQNWLELQYGWLPLISDAQDGAIFLADLFNGALQQRYVARHKRPGQIVSNNGNALFKSARGFESGQIIAFLREKDTLALSGLVDWKSVVWEKTPYSFVADWFIPIGNYLAARSLARSLTGTFVTTRTTYLEASHIVPNPSSTIQYLDGETYSYQDRVVRRTVSTTLAVPLPSFKSLSQAASWKHCANAVALLTSSLTGRKIAGLHDPRFG